MGVAVKLKNTAENRSQHTLLLRIWTQEQKCIENTVKQLR